MPASQKEEKERFFDALFQLDHLSDDEGPPTPVPVPPPRPSPAKIVPGDLGAQQPSAPNIAPGIVPPPRALASAPSIASKAVTSTQPSAFDVAVEIELPPKNRTEVRQSTILRPRPPLISSKSSKGKKFGKMKRIPQLDQIFTGSTFYFIPNDDVAQPRKMRIQRALQYGATWERVWSAGVTHVVVDSYIKMSDVLKHSRVEKLPVGSHTVPRSALLSILVCLGRRCGCQ